MTQKPTVHKIAFNVGERSSGTALSIPKVRVGDIIEEGGLIAEIETEKVAYELVAPARGRVVELTEGEFYLGSVVARLEELPPPKPVASPPAVAAAASPPPAPIEHPRIERPLVVSLGSVGRRVALEAVDARIASLGSLAHAEASAHAVRIARACASLPELMPADGLALAYLSVRGGIETRTVLRVAVHHDEHEVEVLPHDAPVDVVVVRFHDALEHAWFRMSAWRIVIGAPVAEPVLDPSGVITLAPRALLTIELPQPPAIARRFLAAVTEQIERRSSR